MDLDELKAKWAEQDKKLDASLRLNHQILNATRLNQARSALQRLVVGLSLETALTFAIMVVLGDFIYEHRTLARYVVPAVALDLYAFGILNSLIRQIIGAVQIDYNGPVLAIQKQIEKLRMLRIRSTQWIFLTAPLVWTPLLIVAFKGLTGLNAYRIFNPAWLAGNLLFGVAFILIGLWLSKRYGDRMGRSPFIQRLMQDLAGHNLNAATRFLATLSDFAEESREEQ